MAPTAKSAALLFVGILFLTLSMQAQVQPSTFYTNSEIVAVKAGLVKYPLLKQSYTDIKKEVDAYLGKDVDVPFPKDAAGGYTHDKHKSNYILMFNSGMLFNLTGNKAYALLVKNMLLKYAALNPTLKNHPKATSGFPGHLFWQALNDANWLVYTGMAYDCIYSSLSTAERKTIEDGAFKPEVDYFTKDLKNWFNLIHNQSVWAAAGVGIVGIATHNKAYVDMALYGTELNKQFGFMALMDGLFAPDGYYTEGPYYLRYAILPYYIFANALQHARPEMKVFEYRNNILQKALMGCLQQTNSDGVFFAMNDALKDKDYTTNELVSAVDIAVGVYGKLDGLLTVAKKQNRVLLNKGGMSIAAAIATDKTISAHFPYRTIEFTDGVKGDEGGVSILRSGADNDLTSLIYKYTSHGYSHGHFDKLNFNLFDKGHEIFTDYGSVRFIGIEQKYGGRYLPENEAYSMQTIAHNTIVADETSHFNGKEKIAQAFHSDKLFSDLSHPNLQVVVAKDDHAYSNIHLQRHLYFVQIPQGNKMVIDIFNALSPEAHQYDLPFQYNGQFINASFALSASKGTQQILGEKNGYQFIWSEAQSTAVDTTVQFTFLNDRTYYSVSSLVQDTAQLFFTRTGANDPNFNLRHDPSFIIRKKGTNEAFISALEIHGKFDPVNEFSSGSYPSVKQIHLRYNDADYTVVEMKIGDEPLLVVQCNKDFDSNHSHSIVVNNRIIKWEGAYSVMYKGQALKYK